jgi:hypothetical protein
MVATLETKRSNNNMTPPKRKPGRPKKYETKEDQQRVTTYSLDQKLAEAIHHYSLLTGGSNSKTGLIRKWLRRELLQAYTDMHTTEITKTFLGQSELLKKTKLLIEEALKEDNFDIPVFPETTSTKK